jgi:glycosyltransferase involved in cell wall biosynthesis
MRILHIIPSLHGGGAESFCINLCNELSKEHDVTICSLFDIDEHMFMAKALNPSIKQIILHKQLGLDVSMFFKINQLIHSGNYDCVNTHLRALFYSAPAIVINKTKFFHTVHSLATTEIGKVQRFIYKTLFKFFNATPIGISKKVSASIQSEYGNQFNVLIDNGSKQLKPTEEIELIRHEIQSYKRNEDTKVFLTIGRIAPEKNHRMLIEVFNRLLIEKENVLLLIIGKDDEIGDPLLNQLLQIANSEIHFLGMKQNVSDYLHCSDAFCLSSLYEGLPMTLIEAMSLGVIPICTPAGGIVDVLHDMENGLLSTDISDESYYAKIKQFLSLNVQTKETLSQNALKDFKNSYDIAATADKYIDLYKKGILL